MTDRLKILGIVLLIIGVGFVGAGAYAYTVAQGGYDSLQSFSEAQNVTLSYNEAGQLTDRGTTEGAVAIMALLTDDWGYPVADSELNPDDPLVNTASEYMYQMAVIAYHVMHGSQTVTLAEDAVYNGETFLAGTHEFEVDGRYWTDFDRQHPIEGPARGQAWSGTAHGLVGELGVGTVTASTLKMAMGLVALFVGIGFTLILSGAGLIWASRSGAGVQRLEWTETPMESVPTEA